MSRRYNVRLHVCIVAKQIKCTLNTVRRRVCAEKYKYYCHYYNYHYYLLPLLSAACSSSNKHKTIDIQVSCYVNWHWLQLLDTYACITQLAVDCRLLIVLVKLKEYSEVRISRNVIETMAESRPSWTWSAPKDNRFQGSMYTGLSAINFATISKLVI